MMPLVSFPVSLCFWLAPPPDLCGWRYLARVLVEGLRRRRPPAMAWSAYKWSLNMTSPNGDATTHSPDDACRYVKALKVIAGGAVS